MKRTTHLLTVATALVLAGCFGPSTSSVPSPTPSSAHRNPFDQIADESAAVAAQAAEDPEVDRAARRLAADYLESQKKGEDAARFGDGASSFYNLAEYNLQGFGRNEMGQACFLARVKAGNSIGGAPTWRTAWIFLRQAGASGSYGGVEIGMVYLH